VHKEVKKTQSATRFSEAKVRDWYKSYVEKISAVGKKSSRDDDAEAARSRFGFSVPREFLRALRKEFAPAEWTAKGAPKRKEG